MFFINGIKGNLCNILTTSNEKTLRVATVIEVQNTLKKRTRELQIFENPWKVVVLMTVRNSFFIDFNEEFSGILVLK